MRFIYIFAVLGLFQLSIFGQGVDLDNKPAHVPGLAISGISLDDTSLYSIPTEKCTSSSIAVIDGVYFLSNKVYIFKTDKGYGVANIDLSYRDLETGVRRGSLPSNASCRLVPERKIEGDIDCLGARMVKKLPYDQCVYDVKIWAHSLQDKEEAFQIVYKKLQEQFIEYRSKCKIQKKTTLQDRMKIF